jgi:hypothetical protein
MTKRRSEFKTVRKSTNFVEKKIVYSLMLLPEVHELARLDTTVPVHVRHISRQPGLTLTISPEISSTELATDRLKYEQFGADF